MSATRPQATPNSVAFAPGTATWIAIAVALLGPPLFAVVSHRISGRAQSLPLLAALQLFFCGLAAFIFWTVLRVERLTLESIGLRRPDWSTLIWGMAFWLGALQLWPALSAALLGDLSTPDVGAGIDALARLPIWFRLIVAVTGGIVEETLYRGYAVERLASVTGRRLLGGAISALAFGLAHVPTWGLAFSLGADLPFGIIMTAFYLWRRDLWANILAHSTGLVVSMLTVVR
jgi:membrane protease YdiL (CAAX protease family)